MSWQTLELHVLTESSPPAHVTEYVNNTTTEKSSTLVRRVRKFKLLINSCIFCFSSEENRCWMGKKDGWKQNDDGKKQLTRLQASTPPLVVCWSYLGRSLCWAGECNSHIDHGRRNWFRFEPLGVVVWYLLLVGLIGASLSLSDLWYCIVTLRLWLSQAPTGWALELAPKGRRQDCWLVSFEPFLIAKLRCKKLHVTHTVHCPIPVW